MSGLFALLDDIAAIAKATASTIDDIAGQAATAGGKAAGVVIDDTAVTPKYVLGLSPARELPIIWNIAKGSLKNKLFILLPAALLLGWLAPWSVKPLLGLGGLFLCFEGYEKLHELVHGWFHRQAEDEAEPPPEAITPEELERLRTTGAIRTDFILSAEIMAIAYASVAERDLITQGVALVAVAFGITAMVYGFVGVIVKADDVGSHWANQSSWGWLRGLGRFILWMMPGLLSVLSLVGMAAMLWVGGGIVIHSVDYLHHQLEHLIHSLHLAGFLAWCVEAGISFLFAVLLGWPIAWIVEFIKHRRGQTPAKHAH